MKILFRDHEIHFAGDIKLLETIMKREHQGEFPELLKWKVQILYNDGRWIEICRIDNYLHEGKAGAHMHMYNSDYVKPLDITVKDAEKLAADIAKKILSEQFNRHFEWRGIL